MTGQVSEPKPDNASQQISDLTAGQMSEHMPERTSEHIPEHFPAFMCQIKDNTKIYARKNVGSIVPVHVSGSVCQDTLANTCALPSSQVAFQGGDHSKYRKSLLLCSQKVLDSTYPQLPRSHKSPVPPCSVKVHKTGRVNRR